MSSNGPTSTPLPLLGLVLVGSLWQAPSAQAHGDVWVVDQAGGGDFVDLQAAVDASADGDTLLVKPGVYLGCGLSGKGLSIIGDGGGVRVGFFGFGAPPAMPGIQISNTLAHQEVVLSGLAVWGFRLENGSSWDVPALTLSDVQGPLRVEACGFFGDFQACDSCGQYCEAGVAVRGWDVLDADFSHCEIHGGLANSASYCGLSLTQGGRGVDVVGGNLSFHHCIIRGGDGATAEGDLDQGGHGRDAIHARDSATVPVRLYLAGSSAVGGRGGDGDWCWDLAGSGGDGVDLAGAQARLWTLDSHLAGGPAGCGPGGIRGVPLNLGGGATAKAFPGEQRFLLAPSPLREGEVLKLEFRGLAGDRVWLLTAQRAGWRVHWPYKAPLLLATPSLQGTTFMGTVPGSGILTGQLDVPSLPVGVAVESLHTQALFRDLNGNTRLSGSWTRLVLDSAY